MKEGTVNGIEKQHEYERVDQKCLSYLPTVAC
jgi:hypothetical protein